MKRFVTYFYEYHNAKKGSNIGFLKLDQRGTECRMLLHLQTGPQEPEKGEIDLLVEHHKDGTIRGIPLGEVSCGTSGGESVFRFEEKNMLGSGYALSEVKGVVIRFPSSRYLASCWVEEPFEELTRGTFTELKEEKEATVTEVPTKPEEKRDGNRMDQTEIPSKPEEEREKNTGNQGEMPRMPNEQKEEKTVDMTEISSEPEEIPSKPKDDLERGEIQREEMRGEEIRGEEIQGEKIQGEELQIQESAEEEKEPRKVDLSEIKKLPRRNWYLCNNSFLIHGYFNYHHLMIHERIRNGCRKSYLGVPGVYEKPEHMMALLFGFPEFISEQDLFDKKEKEAETDDYPEGTFGYWFCLLDL